MRPAEPWSFWAANSTAICKRICAFPLNVAFILCGLCKEHSEKEVSRKNNEGKGCGVRVVKTPLMVLFDKSSFRILPVYQVLVNAMNGLFWQLLSTFEGLLPYGNAKWQRWDHQLEGSTFKKVLRPLALLAASRPKMPAPQNWFNCMYYVYFNKQLVIKIIANFTASNIHCPQLARTLRNSRGWYIASLASSHESEVKWFIKRQNRSLILSTFTGHL